MSPPKSISPLETPAPIRSAGPHRKPKADLYTVLLVISLIAVLLGILYLYLYNSRLNFERKSSQAEVMVRDQGPGARGQRFERPAAGDRCLAMSLLRFRAAKLAVNRPPLIPNYYSLTPDLRPLSGHGCSKTC